VARAVQGGIAAIPSANLLSTADGVVEVLDGRLHFFCYTFLCFSTEIQHSAEECMNGNQSKVRHSSPAT
jgi:hypothetical protein